MKQSGNYYDHPTLGLLRVPDTVMLNQYEYEYHPDLGFIKKIKKAAGKVLKPVEKVLKPLVPKAVSKIVPKELKGGIEKPLALAAGGYGLYTLGAGGIAAGAKSIGSAVASTAAKVGGGALTAAKVAAPVAGSFLVSAGKAAGQIGTAALQAAPAIMQAQQAVQQQQAQATISEIETNAQLEALAAQRQHERDMLEIQLTQMRAGSSQNPQAIVLPGASGPALFSSGSSGAAAGGMNQNTLLMLGAGAVVLAMLATRK